MNATDIGVGIIGYGRAARTWHMPAYIERGVRVIGAYDMDPAAMAAFALEYPELRRYEALDALLRDPAVVVVDLATRPPGRIELMTWALEAGKHVLVQKPVSADLTGACAVARAADERGLRIAVNVNGRWAPAWRAATELVTQGAVGEIQSITHVFDTRLAWAPNAAVQGTDQFLLFDYTTHWVDITRHWVGGAGAATVQARDYAAPTQPDGQRLETMWLAIDFECGPSAVIRGAAAGIARAGHPFWIHGAKGTIRGDVDCEAGDRVELEQLEGTRSLELAGAWFPDAFGETMLELLDAVAEGREPSNSLRDHLGTLAIVDAACKSARRCGHPIVGTVDLWQT